MKTSAGDQSTIYERPAEILQYLIQFNTTNPPGNEASCINYIKNLLDWAGIQNTIISADPARPNLVARLPGQGLAPPLLMYGHIDVVTTTNQKWRVNPFAGEELDGYIWGRGALDMKGAIAMMLAALLRLKLVGPVPPGDILLAILCDEESKSAYGAEYIVSNCASLFQGAKYAISEFGGYTSYVFKHKFYPIMVAEKQGCGIIATIRGHGGHGAWPVRGGIMAKVARFLQSIEHHLPVHITSVAKEQVRTTAEGLPSPLKQTFMQMLVPALTNSILDTLGAQVRTFAPILHNTVAATSIYGGESYNMIPSQITIGLDCRVLPGFTSEDLLKELKAVAGDDVDFEVSYFNPGPPEPDMGLYQMLAAIIRKADPNGTPTPMLFPAVTDARHFAKLGIQTYGFTPLNLPPEINFEQLFHAANERVPVKALDFGTEAIFTLLRRYRK
ncbi:MAG: M20/M25/M40 family metallo-hydrolase [Dehalococcoidia bacterium]|nr:M20/M25/M40 family metallo-hydrolase [Dehalococcoidia bacterium]MDD5494366.1 M20/M25/M40 family metallo-hydrolase [Dehalococcoidia bacterium]